ncbi:hypothetical protein [Rhizobium sp.]
MATKKGNDKSNKLTGSNGDDVLYGLGGNDTLESGKGNDDLLGGDGNDRFISRGLGYGSFDGGKGNDTVSYAKAGTYIIGYIDERGIGTAEHSKIDSFRRMENIIGSKFGDSINNASGFVYGGAGNDEISAYGHVMRGDAGADSLVGSTSTSLHDTFWLQRGQGADTVTFFASYIDTIWLDGDDFKLGGSVGINELTVRTSSTAASEAAKAQLIYVTDSKALYYDPDGVGGKAAELIAYFNNSSTPSWYDFEII